MFDPEQLTHGTTFIIAYLRHPIMSISSPDQSVGHALPPEASCMTDQKPVIASARRNELIHRLVAEDIIPPMRGQTVTLTLDRQGFVRAVQPADGSEVVPSNRAAPGATSAQRDTTITRLAVLKAAAEFAARPATRPTTCSNRPRDPTGRWETAGPFSCPGDYHVDHESRGSQAVPAAGLR